MNLTQVIAVIITGPLPAPVLHPVTSARQLFMAAPLFGVARDFLAGMAVRVLGKVGFVAAALGAP